MQVQTNSSIDNYAPAILIPDRSSAGVKDCTSSTSELPRQSKSTAETDRGHAPTEPLLDWNQCPPDGTVASRQAALNCLARRFKGDVYVAFPQSGGNCEQCASQPLEDSVLRSYVRSATSEAARAKQNCLFAAAGGQSSLVLQQLRQAVEGELVLGFAASCDSSHLVGQAVDLGIVVCVHSPVRLQSQACYSALIAQTQRELQRWLQVWLRCRAGAQAAAWQRRFRFYRTRRGRMRLIAGGLLLACMGLPLPYWPQRVCVVEPASKSFVASPIDGRIRQALVRPGDVVVAGQLLARLDDEQLRWRLSTAESQYAAASKKRDTALATRAGGELRLAQLEQERIALQIESLEQQLDRLELRSPVAGVVVQGDWFQSDGAPVTRGDMLFEIASMDNMRVDIHLSSADLARIEVGQTATVRVDAAPGDAWSAQLSRIDPRGKVIDSEVVFEGTIDVENASGQLRPGMKGTARLSSGTQSLAWLLFHRPAMWAMKKLAW